MITCRMFLPADHADVCRWWEKRKWTPQPLDALPIFGLMAVDGDTKLACGWMYISTTHNDRVAAHVEWLVTNPDAPLRARTTGLELVLARLVEEAQGFRPAFFFSSLKSKSLMRMFERHGFKRGDEGMTNFIRVG